MKTVLFLSPGYPAEMPFFVHALAELGARVLGIGDSPRGLLPPQVQRDLAAYLQVPRLWDEEGVLEAVRNWGEVGGGVDRVECLWEPGMLLAARLREFLRAPGLSYEGTVPFRNKERMKQVLDAAGIRTPRHRAARSPSEIQLAAEAIGFPLIVKPIAGAGSADTFRVESPADLERAIAGVRHHKEVSVEEFIDGEEFTFDTISIRGEPAFFNVAWYRPRPLVARTQEWISPQVIALRYPDQPLLVPGVRMGFAVLRALGFESGFTHMEWYQKSNGEAVFGEIAARPPGAHQVDQMNYVANIDVFRGWATAVLYGRFDQEVRRLYNVANIYKRAQGQGRIRRIEGLEDFIHRYRSAIVRDALLPVGSPRRNWKQTLVSDGYFMLRHPDLRQLLEMADAFGREVQLYAA
jgi:hypothetical protein